MANLTPQQRPDKNGKVVTRHVKSDAGTPSKVLNLPAPKVEEEKNEARINYIKASIRGAYDAYAADTLSYFDEDDDEYYEAEKKRMLDGLPAIPLIVIALEKLPASTVGHIASTIADSAFDIDYQMNLGEVVEGLNDHKLARTMETFTFLHGHLGDIFNRDKLYGEEISSYEILKGAILSLDGYQHLGYKQPEHIFDASKEEQDMVLMLSKLRYMAPENSGTHILDYENVVRSDGLVKLILENPEKSERILEVMEARETDDAELIASIIESESQALSSGHL